MSLYSKRQKWKLYLLIAGVSMCVVSLFFLNILITRVQTEERKSVLLWAEAIQKKSSLVEYTKELFDKLQVDERQKVELWSDAMHRLLNSDNSSDLTILVKIISSNKNIPIILTNDKGIVISSINLDKPIEQGKKIPTETVREFSKYPPIRILFNNKLLNKLYYKDSKLFAKLQLVMNDIIQSFFTEVVGNSASVPVIITDVSKKNIIAYGNIERKIVNNHEAMLRRIHDMENSNLPIEIMLSKDTKNYIFYEESYFLKLLRYYPIAISLALFILIVIAYLAFAASRKYEQNQVWMGMSKETAHQLGTPISSLMAWVDILRLKGVDEDTIIEIEKDINRLQIVADRFSKIGSKSAHTNEDLVCITTDIVDYMRKRISPKITITVNYDTKTIIAPISKTLFEWVIENLCKNAIDSIGGTGSVVMDLFDKPLEVVIDITDTGKGIPRSKFKTIFKPGYTTKKRGWGLGLTLAKRIVEEYHKGKIFVKQSEPEIKTTFRIILQKK
jgi:signal transduction histidine kinase